MGEYMKKRLVMTLMALTLVLSGCGSQNQDPPAGTQAESKTQESTQESIPETKTDEPVQPQPSEDSQEPSSQGGDVAEVDLAQYLSDPSKWQNDGGDFSLENEELVFNNAYYGDFCAVMVDDRFQDVTVKFTLQMTDIAADVSEEAGTWWDSEFLCLVRSNFAGSAFVEGEEGQAGYCITSWGDMSQFALGRSGYDDAFGIFDWPLGDGEPHQVEFTVDNSEDGTKILLKVVVDGQEIASVEDDGSLVKKERVSFFPEAGGITLRCKYLGAKITGF